jgi:putative ABC transport system permease protein
VGRLPLWRLPPWTRAPLLGLRQPAAVVAVLVTSAVLACAVASAPLFLSSARSAALQQQLAPQCAEAAWPQTGSVARFGQRVPAEEVASFVGTYAGGWAQQGRAGHQVLVVPSSLGASGNYQRGIPARGPDDEPLSQNAAMLWRPDVTAHVQVVSGSDASGLWLPASYASAAHARVGDQLLLAGQPFPVAGVYTDLFATDPGPYWCDMYLNPASADTPPPALLLPTDERVASAVAGAAGMVEVREQVPVDASRLSVSDARGLLTEQERAQALGQPSRQFPPSTNARLPQAVARASLIEAGLRGPVVPVAVAGAVLALVLVASAGSFWADRRAAEVRLLAARGVGPVPLAAKAALELGLPALAGAAVGWAASRLLTGALGPADDLDPAATTAAVRAGVAAFVVGLAGAAAVAGVRARGSAERPLGAAPRWPAQAPWELALLAAAAGCWVLLRAEDAVVSAGGVAQVNGLLVAFPLLGTAGAAVLLARLLVLLLPRVRRWAGRRSPAVFLAVNRLAAARLAPGTLLVAVTLPVAVLGYTATLTAGSQTTLDAKVGVQIGATRAVITLSRFRPTAQIDRVGTYVVRYEGTVAAAGAGSSGGRRDVQVLAVDPDDFAGTAFWNDSFADRSLPDLLATLSGPAVGGRVPVVAAGLPSGGDPDLRLGRQALPAQVVAQARVLPGRRSDAPVVLVAADRVPEIQRSAGAARQAEVWTNGALGPAVAALVDAGGSRSRELEPATVLQVANFLAITWTFGYLSALAVFIGVIAVGGLLLYLEARSRTRVSGYVMARRLGLSRGAHLRSLGVELAGVALAGLVLGAVLAAAAVAVVYRRLDVDLLRPPTPLLDVPWPAIAATAGATAVLAGLAALYAQHAADRADPATVLREDA